MNPIEIEKQLIENHVNEWALMGYPKFHLSPGKVDSIDGYHVCISYWFANQPHYTKELFLAKKDILAMSIPQLANLCLKEL